jgi:hypothetical protein
MRHTNGRFALHSFDQIAAQNVRRRAKVFHAGPGDRTIAEISDDDRSTYFAKEAIAAPGLGRIVWTVQ